MAPKIRRGIGWLLDAKKKVGQTSGTEEFACQNAEQKKDATPVKQAKLEVWIRASNQMYYVWFDKKKQKNTHFNSKYKQTQKDGFMQCDCERKKYQ